MGETPAAAETPRQEPLFGRVALIGIGLIGSSLSHAMRRGGLAGEIVGHARSRPETISATVARSGK